ncbi:DUF6008 family protein [Amycolatopsis sp., V23-08]|uniref:DUF6008 family protein n=1 Tax=Amycolatopsis heterodermiae TaxID=3110235 RepID=A0ABU5RHD9_9PSEU|nr:DUF6008 family protein [Amycolatopsis sp., V23-08]MEA5365004.1 DUF6008 family protein [Amycolatopsis sp., V23-08]
MTMPMSAMSGWDTAGATLLVLWALAMWAAVGVLAYANRGPVRPWVYRGSVLLIGVGVLGQLGHVQEHVAQVGYWLGHPNSPAWMTPWGTSLANGLQMVLPNRPTFGMELLHLTGNFIFLAGLVGVMVITRRATQTRARRWGKMGVWMQGIHGLEHLVLTLSVAFGSRAIGLSTFFGLIDPGPGLTTYRVWWHFIANVIGTIIFGLAVYHLWKERRAVRATYFVRPAPVLTEQAA